MNDPEVKELFNKAKFILAVVLVFAIPVFFVIKNKLVITESSVLKDIQKKEIVLLYITEEDCSNCKKIKKELDKQEIEYDELNKDTNKDYKTIIRKIGLSSSKLYTPTLVYVVKGKTESYIVDIKSIEELNNYIDNIK